MPPDITMQMRRAGVRIAARERQAQRLGREAAREIVDAAVALGLAEDRDDAGGRDRALLDRGDEPRDVIRSGRAQPVHMSLPHLALPPLSLELTI